MAQRLRQAVLLVVVGLRGEHVPVVLGHEVAFARIGRDLVLRVDPAVRSGVDEVVVGVDVFVQVRLGEVPDSRRGAGRIEFPRRGVGSRVEGVVVLGLVDAHAPGDDRGVVAPLADHVDRVADGPGLPFRSADVLPAGDLGDDEQADLVAALDEVVRLGVVAGPHDRAAQFSFEDVGVEPLGPGRGRVSEMRVGLVPVQAAQGEGASVEEEALGAPFDRPEADPQLFGVHFAPLVIDEGDRQAVQVGALRAPGRDAPDLEGGGEAMLGQGMRLVEEPFAPGAVEGDAERQAVELALDLRVESEGSEMIRAREHVRDARPARHLQVRFAVEPAVSEVVDDSAEGRLVEALTRVEANGDRVRRPHAQEGRQVELSGRPSALVHADGFAVAEDLRAVGGSVEDESNRLALPFAGGLRADGRSRTGVGSPRRRSSRAASP